ncbi:MAG: repair protein RadC protein, partial [Candidatus Moranbacteria bacterium GW2011_GWD2_38_7]
MPKIKDIAKVDRPREILEKYGPEKLSDAQLLAILLRTGTKDCNVIELSKKILKKFPNEKLLSATIEDLSEIHGLGKVKATEILACLEFGRRILKDKKSALILSPKDVWENCKDIRDHKKEHFVVFYLDTRNQEIQREIISVGTLNANLVHPREVFEPAIKHSCAQIIVAHNHPSGNPEPSDDDLAI